MNFDRSFRIPYTENRDSWRPLINGMPIPRENGIGHGQGSMPIMRGENGILGGWDPTLASRRPMLMNNGTLSGQQSCTTNDNGNYWSSSNNTSGENGNHWSIHGREFDSMNSWNPVTPKKLIYEKPNPTHVEFQEHRVETENWQDLIGMYTGVLQQNTLDSNNIHENINRRPPTMVQSNEKPKWVTRPSRHQNSVSNQASNFISTDPANWKCGHPGTIISSSSNLTCVPSANEASNNGVCDLRLLFNQNRPTQVESNIMRTTSWTSTLENHPTQRPTSNNLISRPKDGFPGANQHAYGPSSPPTFKPDATAYNILDSFPFDPITPYNSRKYNDCEWVTEKVNFKAAETSTRVKQSKNNQTVSTKDADDLYNELLQTIRNSPPSAVSTSQNENVRSNKRDELVIDLNQTPQQQTPDTNKNFPFAPVTPYNQQKHVDGQWVAEKVNFPAEETSTTDQTVSTKDADYLFNELVQTIGDSPPSAMSSTQKEQIVSNEREEQVIDLNQTPQQKTPNRRKKHRPKVIREGKQRRTPKPKDPTNGSTHETPRVKRKYVRKQGVNSGENTPVESVTKRKYMRKNDISEPPSVDETTLKSCKKKLNFDLGCPAPSVVETAPKSCKKKLNFDLVCPAQDENIKSQQEVYINLNSQEMQQNRRIGGVHVTHQNEYTGGNKVNDRVGIKDNFVEASTVPMYVQGTPVSFTSENMLNVDERRGIKRHGLNANTNALDSFLQYKKFLLGVANRSLDQKSFNLFENHKKLKMQMQNEYQDLEENARQINNIYRNSVGSAMQLLNSCTRVDQSCMAVNSQPSQPLLLDATHHLKKKHVLPEMQPRTIRTSNYTPGAMISWTPTQTTPKWDPRYTVSTYPSANSLEKKQIAKPRSYNQRLDGLSQNVQQQHQGYQQASTIARGRQRTKKAEVSIESITHMLEGLHIYDGNKKQQNQLIVYRNSDAMIPFEPIKKRAPRPRVDLDTETERVWRQLMGIEGSEGPTTKDKDKEKWWEDERRVFRGRADSFIARMHLVQGDRRFSRWKGSVVDSVIGVFLTQNVSDHLSSSAFMSLAARFPLKSTTTNKVCCQDRVHDKPYEVSEPIEFTKCHEKIISLDSFENMTHRTSSIKGATYKHSNISVEEINLSQDSFSSSTIDEFRSSSGSNSHVEDVTTAGFKTGKQSGPLLNLMQEYIPVFGGKIPNKQNSFENTVYEASSKQKAFHDPPSGPDPNSSKGRKVKTADERKQTMHWDSLRKEALLNGKIKERNKDAADSLDYEALRCAHVDEISDAIRERGMNNMLADRMKDFLNRLVRDHGSIDLEWLRDAPPDKAKDYLLSFRGLGLKSVECVRLLTLHHLAFPVDTNVGRIAVRLGWVPLQPLPESLQLHLLEMYPILESIQKYLWPRLCKLDQLTLYELHYQMITFGKVFCTKSKPNCNACPMRAECRHFASAYASARLALPGPEEKRIVTSDTPVTTPIPPPIVNMPLPLPPSENNFNTIRTICEPIIEEPSTPEPEPAELTISDIEDQYYGDDSDEIPSIKLNMEEFTTNLQNIIQDSKQLQENMSKALVALNPNAASIPTPKLKDVSRLRTEHLVYELPDSHPLLDGLDKREPDDPSHYLLAIWTPGETANSVQPPEIECPAQQSGRLCDRATCFSCNNVKEANSQVVRGTILIPCRTAMRGSFPLNGTYFQVNEMFADHESSLEPIAVPRAWIWNLPRRKVYFGTSVTTIFKGLSTEGIQYCFWKGFVCVRGFDRIKRAPRPLMARLHFPASRLLAQRMKKTNNNNNNK